MKHFYIFRFYIAILFLLSSICLSAQESAALRAILEQEGSSIVLSNGTNLISKRVIPTFYNGQEYRLMWTEEENRESLLNNIRASDDEGLNPEDYHLKEIETLAALNYSKLEEQKKAELDLIFSDAFIQLGAHLNSGKVDQSDLDYEWNVERNPLPYSPDSLIAVTLHNKNISKLLESLKPQTYLYHELKAALREYKNLALRGGWPKMSEGETLKKGMSGERVLELRNYLAATGDLNNSKGNLDLFDDELENAVKKFQERFSLTQDGVVGKGVLAEMNVSVENRIDQIRVNLERSRWVLHDLNDDFLVVNVAGFYLRRITNGKSVFYSRVIVGKNQHKSPVFKDEMEFVDLNPTWTIPYSIATNETLPKMKNNPNYLASQNILIYDKGGHLVNPANLDLNQYSKGNFPFTLVQQPGAHNALGEVKFMFPNKYAIYLHDTPSRSLFEKQDRAFSHGCIRLDDKWGLFLNLLGDKGWTQEKIDEVIKSRKTTRIKLDKPIDIYILYWTASVDENNKVIFIRDVYKRDSDVLKALNKPLS
ncbi:L,D-transpeptidase family protein [Namhaeicola litoreus]|uniref:Murein L,D-transpeptidase n=1 Tax=Namhaeicola litoreus TaxID=1052145 RepID=A0ABW3Y3G0_9FLAO